MADVADRGCEGDHNCNCNGKGACHVTCVCTACRHRFEACSQRAVALKRGHKMPMGRAFQCPACKRRGTCNGEKAGERVE